MQPAAALKGTLFGGLPAEKAEALETITRRRSFQPGQIVCHKGDPGDAMYIILQGQVKIVLPSEGGEEAVLAVFEQGDFFGELSLIDGEPRSATIVATERTEALVLYRNDFLEYLKRSPEAAFDLLLVLSRRLRRTDELIADAAFLDVPGRLAKRLLELSERYGRPGSEGTTMIRLRLTQRDIAAMIGATRESVNKHLRSFTAQGMIVAQGRHIVIRDTEKLRRRVY